MAKTLGGEGAASFTQDAAESRQLPAQSAGRASACPHDPRLQNAPPPQGPRDDMSETEAVGASVLSGQSVPERSLHGSSSDEPSAAGRSADGVPLQGLSAQGLAQVKAAKGPPPVHLWNPPFCGAIDMRIARDGTWFHDGTPIGRMPLVKLFAGILKREGLDYFLVTPVEKVSIRVDDAPFVAVDVDAVAGGFALTTTLGDRVLAGPNHPLYVTLDCVGEPAPYVHIRRDLWARIDRKTFYRLVDAAQERDGVWGIVSQGVFFALDGSA